MKHQWKVRLNVPDLGEPERSNDYYQFMLKVQYDKEIWKLTTFGFSHIPTNFLEGIIFHSRKSIITEWYLLHQEPSYLTIEELE